MLTALINGRVLNGGGAVERRAVLIEDARIAAIVAADDVPAGAERYDLEGRLLLPGFVDTQVNGGGGVLFGDAPSVETLARIARAHIGYGTTAFLPTLISGDVGTIARAMDAVAEAIDAGVPGVAGIHVEGPFLNPNRCGIHDPSNFREIDDKALQVLTSLRRGVTVVTLAPELVPPAAIETLVKSGAIVSAGHTDARHAEVRLALQSGLSGFTHLFNAMSPLRAREPGAVGAALDDRASFCGIIVDGRHVDPATLRVALSCRGIDKLMLVSDAMPSVGAATKSFQLQGRTITVKDGVCMAPDGTLAGCDLDMASAVRNAMAMMGASLHDAVVMASRTPAAFLGLSHAMGRIAPGLLANLVAADDALDVYDVWIDGLRQPRRA